MASGGDPLPGHWKLLDAQSGWGLLKIEGSEAKGLVPPVLLGIGGPRPWKWGSLKTVGGGLGTETQNFVAGWGSRLGAIGHEVGIL